MQFACKLTGNFSGKITIFNLTDRNFLTYIIIWKQIIIKCDEVFKTLYLYKAHMAYKHEGQQMHKCPMCDAELKSKQTLRTHIAFVHEGKACERMRWDQF